MAIGLGKLFGFDFLENFRYPFISSSISEFWRRWHISLGSWFRDYLYIPMGGNRVNKPRFLLNIFTVWFLTGFWHGAEWNFVVWGLYFAVLLLIEKWFLAEFLQKNRVIAHLYVLFFTAISFAIFSGSGLEEALSRVGGMFGAGGLPLTSLSFWYQLRNYGVVLLIAILCATPVFVKLKERLMQNKVTRLCLEVLEIPFLLLLLVIVTAYLADGSFNPFLYFRF